MPEQVTSNGSNSPLPRNQDLNKPSAEHNSANDRKKTSNDIPPNQRQPLELPEKDRRVIREPKDPHYVPEDEITGITEGGNAILLQGDLVLFADAVAGAFGVPPTDPPTQPPTQPPTRPPAPRGNQRGNQ